MNELGLIFIRGDKIALRRIRKVCKTVACKWSMGIGRKASLCKMSMYWGQYAKWAFLWAFFKKNPARLLYSTFFFYMKCLLLHFCTWECLGF